MYNLGIDNAFHIQEIKMSTNALKKNLYFKHMHFLVQEITGKLEIKKRNVNDDDDDIGSKRDCGHAATPPVH